MMCLICSLKLACEAGEAGDDGKTWCRNLISAVPCCAYAHMPGQSDYGTLDRRHQRPGRAGNGEIYRTAVYAVLASINIKRHRKTMSHEKTKRKTILHLQLHLWSSTSFRFSLHSSLIWSFSMPDGQDFCHFHFSSLCAPHVVSPRDLWLCVLPRWQFNVNVNVNSW